MGLTGRGFAAVLVVGCVACGRGPAIDRDAGGPDAARAGDAAPTVDAAALDDRDRLLASYLAFLRTRTAPQSNGLDGRLPDVCALWAALDPSSRATFLTLTARMAGARLADGSAMLGHVTALYRAVGGAGATATDPGSCGGGEYNRLIVSIDPELHAALVAANVHHGNPDGGGHVDVADIPTGSAWRDSHDLGGTHPPFDLSDETEAGAPRAQLQVFADPAAASATAPLGRVDLIDVVDPFAMEIDHDFDCFHNSNPACPYTLYGPLCAPEVETVGTAIYAATYGDYGATYAPAGCQ